MLLLHDPNSTENKLQRMAEYRIKSCGHKRVYFDLFYCILLLLKDNFSYARKQSIMQVHNHTGLVSKSCILIAIFISISACSKNEPTKLKAQPYDFEKFALATIAPDDDVAMSLLELAKKHVTPSDNSVYDKMFTQHYDPEFTLYNDLNYIYENDINELPPTVFLSIMRGSRRLHQFDWRSIYDAEELVFILNKVFKQKQLPILSQQEIQLFKIPNITNLSLNEGAILMMEMMVEVSEQRSKDILWLKGGGDYYEFFLVNKGSAQKLHKKRLGSDLMFCANISNRDDCE